MPPQEEELKTEMCLAVPGKIIQVDPADQPMILGKVDFAGIVKDVCLAYVPEAQVGDYIIVHAGFAIKIINRDEAEKVFDYLNEISTE
jgi:hydrogenase expression/formation protein HypC